MSRRNLSTVRDVITSSNGENFWHFCLKAVERGNPYVCQKLASYVEDVEASKESKEVTDVLATARRYTSFIGNECVGPNLSRDACRFAPLKNDRRFVFITLPAQHLANPGPLKWLRLIVDCALHETWSTRPGKRRVLFVMDEFCQYGALPSIRSAMNLARGFGLTLWPVVQSLGDLKATYGAEGWETFVSSAAVKIFMAAECLTTRDVVSKLSGIKTVKVPSYSSGSSTPGIGWPPRMPTTSTSEGVSFNEVAQPVLHPHEVGNIPPDELIARIRGVDQLIRCKRKPYWECPELNGLYDPDPYEAGD